MSILHSSFVEGPLIQDPCHNTLRVKFFSHDMQTSSKETSKSNFQILPQNSKPCCLHATIVSLTSHMLLHTLPHLPPAQYSTRPSSSLGAPWNLTLPLMHSPKKKNTNFEQLKWCTVAACVSEMVEPQLQYVDLCDCDHVFSISLWL